MRRYDSYKDSGIEWIGEIPSHWELVPIKYSLSIPLTDGPHETPELVSDGVIFISAEAIKDDKIDFEKKRGDISIQDHERFSKKYKPEKGDVYMIKSGATTGNLARVETDIEFNIWSPLAAFRPDPKKVTTDFLFFYMKSKRFFTAIELGWNYGTQQNIGMSVLENLRMVRPPIAEQTSIATYLKRKTEEIDELIAKKKRLLELYEEEKISIINQAVTKGLNPNVQMKDSGIEWLGEIPDHWEVKRVKHVLKSLNNIRVPLSADERGKMISRTYDYYGASGIIDKVEDYLFDEPLLLIGEDGANLVTRSTRLAFIARGKYWVNNHAHILKPTFGVLEYWCELLELCDYSIWISGSAQPKLTSENLMNIQVIVPPIEEQNSIISFLEVEFNRINNKKIKTEKLIELLTEYRTALISEVVTGKIKIID